MNQHYLYILVDLGCFLFPFLASFYPKYPFYKHWPNFFKANVAVFIFFVLWDALFTHLQVWGFNPDYLLGIYFYNLPLEELLFFIFVPYSCVFTYFSLKILIKKNPLEKYHKYLSVTLFFVLIWVFALNYNKLYTASTSLFLALYMLYHWYKGHNLSWHYLAYFSVFGFFFISNGILTGGYTLAPVVWYNPMHNIGLRMDTIPIEDLFYGMLMVFLNIDLMKFFEKRRSKTIL